MWGRSVLAGTCTLPRNRAAHKGTPPCQFHLEGFMRRRLVGVTLAIAAALAVAAPAQAAKDPLNAFRVRATPENKQRLATGGFDLTEGDHGKYIEIYATGRQARSLRADGVAAKRITD